MQNNLWPPYCLIYQFCQQNLFTDKISFFSTNTSMFPIRGTQVVQSRASTLTRASTRLITACGPQVAAKIKTPSLVSSQRCQDPAAAISTSLGWRTCERSEIKMQKYKFKFLLSLTSRRPT